MQKDGGAPKARIEGRRIIASVLGMEWLLSHDDDLETLWALMDDTAFADERIPYWAELWPSSLGLAHWLGLCQKEIEGRHCLDCGCGLGLTALAGRWLGGRVLACDYELRALQAARESAQLNETAQPTWVAMDWRKPALAKNRIWRAWAADILYEDRSMRPVFEFLKYCLASGGKAWIAEPGRSIFMRFTEICRSGGWRIEPVYKISVPAMHPDSPMNTVTVWELTGA